MENTNNTFQTNRAQNIENNDIPNILETSYQKNKNILAIEEDEDMLFSTPTIENV